MIFTIKTKALSINSAFQGRRFKTRKCKRYEEEVFYQLPGIHIPGYVKVRYNFYLENWKTTDTDNLVKVLQDIIVKKGMIEDDRKIIKYTAEKHPSDRDYIELEIEQIGEPKGLKND